MEINKEEFIWLKNQHQHRLNMDEAIRKNDKVRYIIQETDELYLVVASIYGNRRILKAYNKGEDNESKIYANQKAEYLCRILSE